MWILGQNGMIIDNVQKVKVLSSFNRKMNIVSVKPGMELEILGSYDPVRSAEVFADILKSLDLEEVTFKMPKE
jgi:hypothetical protein